MSDIVLGQCLEKQLLNRGWPCWNILWKQWCIDAEFSASSLTATKTRTTCARESWNPVMLFTKCKWYTTWLFDNLTISQEIFLINVVICKRKDKKKTPGNCIFLMALQYIKSESSLLTPCSIPLPGFTNRTVKKTPNCHGKLRVNSFSSLKVGSSRHQGGEIFLMVCSELGTS